MFKTHHPLTRSVIAATVLTLSLSACKGGGSTLSNFLTKVDVSVSPILPEPVINMSAQFKLGNVNLPEITVQIPDPKTSKSIGTVTFAPMTDGQAKIAISVHANALPNGDTTLGNSLPNQNPVPLSLGVKTGDLKGFPFMSHSRLYLGGDLKHTVYVGIALAIDGMDKVMGQLGSSANLFFPGTFGSVSAVGGIYGSPNAYQNGIAIFGKYTAPGATQLSQQSVDVFDEEKDQDVEKFDRKTQRKLMRFFYGEERTLQVY